jgi:hypothetical protein
MVQNLTYALKCSMTDTVPICINLTTAPRHFTDTSSTVTSVNKYGKYSKEFFHALK